MNKPISNTIPSDASSSACCSGTSVLSVLSLLESLTLAIALALIIRGFIVEAFVIPTGSMAESLMGEHTEVICKECRYTFTTGIPKPRSSDLLICPNCDDQSQKVYVEDAYGRAGDRVLVLKPMYFLSRYKHLRWLAPKRWDVVVFLYPGSGKDNYIKRLAGLPGETIEVIDGDVYIDGHIARKTPKVQQELWIPVFDNDFQRQRPEQDWPRWQGKNDSSYVDRLHDGRLLRITADVKEVFVAYNGSIDNSLGYNDLSQPARRPSAQRRPATDLRLSFDVIPATLGPAAQLTAVLSKRDDYFRLRLDFSDSASPYVELQRASSLPSGSGHGPWRTVKDDAGRPLRYDLPTAAIGKSVNLALQNVDYEVSVWLNGRQVLATSDSSYKPASLDQARLLGTLEAPSARVFVSARDCQVDLLHIKLARDVYYTSEGSLTSLFGEARFVDAKARELKGQPLRTYGKPFSIPSDDDPMGPAYFMLGDNSSHSFDSRLWSVKHPGLDDDYVRGTVPRDHVFGQAFFVYWPAAGPLVGQQLPLVPRVGKMRLIR